MTQAERRNYLITALLQEQPKYSDIEIPENEQEQIFLLRSLLNVRMPQSVSKTFLDVQNTYLQEEIRKKGITDLADLQPIQEGIDVPALFAALLRRAMLSAGPRLLAAADLRRVPAGGISVFEPGLGFCTE